MNTGTVQFEINSQDMTPPLTLTQMYHETMKAFEINDSRQATINPSICDLTKYEKDFFVAGFSTSHINALKTDTVQLTGRNTQSTSMNISVKAVNGRGQNNAQKATSIIFTEMTSYLLVQAGRNISLIRFKKKSIL